MSPYVYILDLTLDKIEDLKVLKLCFKITIIDYATSNTIIFQNACLNYNANFCFYNNMC